MPNGFCPYAWDTIFTMIMTLKFGGNCSEWYEEPGVAVAALPRRIKTRDLQARAKTARGFLNMPS